MRAEVTFPVALLLFATSAALAQPSESPRPDWITTSNQPCKVWNPEPQPDESVTWSGACKDGFATGEGELKWTENGKPDAEYDGWYAEGKRNGHGVLITPGGDRVEGEWRDDRLVVDRGDTI